MVLELNQKADDLDPRFKIFHELMQNKVRNILLVSTLYDACIMDEDGRLAERIINEYRGLNLSQPPRFTWASSAEEALALLDDNLFDLVITMFRLADMDAFGLAEKLKAKRPDLPIILLSHAVPHLVCNPAPDGGQVIDRSFVWTGNTDLLLGLVKATEDRLNVAHDTAVAGVRVILFVEDSPLYRSALLPVLYKAVVSQIQMVIEEGLNEEHRLLTMRARPKILVAETLEEARDLYEQFRPFVLGVISDVRFPDDCREDAEAGIRLLTAIKADRPDIPLLLASSEESNSARAAAIPAEFLNKNSSSLTQEVYDFLLEHLGFGDFVFRSPDGQEIARAANLRSFETILPTIPLESFRFHADQNDFSRWLFARTEIIVASRLRPVTEADFDGDYEAMRQYTCDILKARRRRKQLGVVASFDSGAFDPEMDFTKIGHGSLGGKARGLVFIAHLLNRNQTLHDRFGEFSISFPQTLIITTDGFDSFLDLNRSDRLTQLEVPDEEIARRFVDAAFPRWVERRLRVYLEHVGYPLAVRSSSLLEDSQTRPYAGLYRTYMLPNNHASLEVRLQQLVTAIKLVYASTFFRDPRSFARSTLRQFQQEKMAVIVQRLVGTLYGDYFYPAISGVAQSRNYYPFPPMKMEDGIAHIAMGLGKIVVEGGKALRFCPKHPEVLPQFAKVDEILKNSQSIFYGLKLNDPDLSLQVNEESTLARLHIMDAGQASPLVGLADTYVPDEQRIRDGAMAAGPKVLTFSGILKYRSLPLAELLDSLLQLGRHGVGCPVEIEFSVNLCPPGNGCLPQFTLLQIRPMASEEHSQEIRITDREDACSFCSSVHALGNGIKRDVTDIIYVDPVRFEVAKTVEIAREINQLNAVLGREGRKYLLIGPGRWGSADRWLGIPVGWADISEVTAIVETTCDELKVEPSQGSHFFHNIASLGIDYVMITEKEDDFLDWTWLKSLPVVATTQHMVHVRTNPPIMIKVDGSQLRCVMTRTADLELCQ